MYSDERQSARSPTTSRTDSYGDGPSSRINDRNYQLRSTINGDNGRDDNEYEEAPDDRDEPIANVRPPQRSEDQYIAALRYRFPSRPKSDYSYSKPAGPANVPPAPPLPSTTQPRATTTTTTTTPRAAPYQSSLRPANTGGGGGGGAGIGATTGSDDRTFPRPALRRVTPDQQNAYARRVTGDTTIPAGGVGARSEPGGVRPTVRINDPYGDATATNTSTFTRPIGSSAALRDQESIFEKVPSHGGPVSYLGTATFSQFEHCLRECLERERRHLGYTSHITRHDLPPTVSMHDYDYMHGHTHDPILTTSASYHGLNPITVHQFDDYPSRPTGSMSIDDIRNINVALSRSGIPLFPYYYGSSFGTYHSSILSPPPHSFISSPYPSTSTYRGGEVVSACRVVDEDPAIISSRPGILAVQNVWNAIRNSHPFSYTNHSRSITPY